MTRSDIIENGQDLVLNEKDTVWLSVGDYSVRIFHTVNGGVKIGTWVRGGEDGVSIDSIEHGPIEAE